MKRREVLALLLGGAALLTTTTADAMGHKKKKEKMEKEMKGNKYGNSADHRKDADAKMKAEEMKNKGKGMKDKMMKKGKK